MAEPALSDPATGRVDLTDMVDLFVIGGGINGCGIARDAAGRGLSAILAEQGDLAQATSSASTKMFHGGLRYLEYFEVHLVREALRERETLLRAMPHISWPLRFVLPISPEMRFESDTPTSRLLRVVMPWARGRRPAWLIRFGLFLYDSMGGRGILPGTRRLDLTRDPAGRWLKRDFSKAYEYSDCWVQDSRLVVLNARDAEARGARILTRTRVVSARRSDGHWKIVTEGHRGRETHRARALINASGPWVGEVIRGVAGLDSRERVRLVRGSHIVTRRLYDHDRCYFLQGPDGRVVFAIPYEQDFTLIGTTDEEHHGDPLDATCTAAERDYLLACVNRYAAREIGVADIVWSYAGVRPLHDDGAKSATAATREYVLRLDDDGAPMLNVFGGKITTYRRLAENALAKLGPCFPQATGAWTAGVPLPGGDFPHDGAAALTARLAASFPFLADAHAARLVRTYGTESFKLLEGATRAEDLGQDFGATLTAAEVNWLVTREYAREADDILWRRTRLGLYLGAGEIAALRDFMSAAVRQEEGQAAAG